MKPLRIVALLSAFVALTALGQKDTFSLASAQVTLAAVSRDESLLRGGIGPSKWTSRGTLLAEPLAVVTESGEWTSLPCSAKAQKNCLKFQHSYLSKPHIYTVVSADGKGATVHSKPTTLSECFDYSGVASYSGGAINHSAIAATSPEMFGDSTPPQPVRKEDASFILTLFRLEPVAKKLGSTKIIRVLLVSLEDKEFYVVQKTFAESSDGEGHALIFGIGVVEPHRFHLLHWKQNTEDEDERVLGTIHLNSGHDFLITVVSDPEGHWYRVYGIRDGKLTQVYAGGGSSC